jgi:hypothetical protein
VTHTEAPSSGYRSKLRVNSSLTAANAGSHLPNTTPAGRDEDADDEVAASVVMKRRGVSASPGRAASGRAQGSRSAGAQRTARYICSSGSGGHNGGISSADVHRDGTTAEQKTKAAHASARPPSNLFIGGVEEWNTDAVLPVCSTKGASRGRETDIVKKDTELPGERRGCAHGEASTR